uniref:Uncharacterized protein n=1 Tax=Cajanus cajan TaxID=3821 RepID=A0A151SB81_CAJCA|nr:hypothetical protein KK1_026106 [Cajanus cajan]
MVCLGAHRNTLFVPEKVLRINRSLNLHKPVKIGIEVLPPINLSFLKAILTKAIDPNVKVPIIQERASGILGHIRGHVSVQRPSLINHTFSRSRIPPYGLKTSPVFPNSAIILNNPSNPTLGIGF